MSSMLKAIQFAGRIVYRLIPPGLSTRLADTAFARRLMAMSIPDGLHVYDCTHGVKIRMTGEEARLTGLAQLGCINPFETCLLFDFVKSGNTVVDVGTYVDGWHSIIASRIVGPQGRVVCFEPSPMHCARFKENCELNNCRNITLNPLALSNAEGEVEFFEHGKDSSMLRADGMRYLSSYKVRTSTLDRYCRENGIAAIDFLKVDTEGADMMVLEGAPEMLGKTRCALLEVADELLGKAGTDSRGVIEFMRAAGFTPYAIQREGVRKYEPGRVTSETMNMLFVRE